MATLIWEEIQLIYENRNARSNRQRRNPEIVGVQHIEPEAIKVTAPAISKPF